MGIVIAIVVIVVVLVVAFAAWRYLESRRSTQLREEFGQEHEHALGRRDSLSDAGSEPGEQASVRPLSSEDRDRFAEEWRAVQTQFVDEPMLAVVRADALITEVMASRGYPAGFFDAREEAIAARHPELADDYRTAHEIAAGQKDGQTSTEELRDAMVRYRSLFEKLVGVSQTESPKALR